MLFRSEIGVASTKAFTAQLTALNLLALYLGQARGALNPEGARRHLEALTRVPAQLEGILAGDQQIEEIARRFFKASDFLFLGRGINYPIALEGALKLKEISYIHAEGYPAGEMKHGPIALIDSDLPVVVIALKDGVYEKSLANIEEVRARDGQVIAVATAGDEAIAGRADHVVYVPEAPPLLSPMVTLVPLQFLAYHIAVRRGCDVDQPRNLAKTVTVE